MPVEKSPLDGGDHRLHQPHYRRLNDRSRLTPLRSCLFFAKRRACQRLSWANRLVGHRWGQSLPSLALTASSASSSSAASPARSASATGKRARFLRAVRSPSIEWPESAQPCRCRAFRRRSPNRAHSGRSALAVGMRPDAPNRKLARYGNQPRRADAPATKRAADRRSYARSEPCQDKNVARLACNQEIESVLLPAPRSEPFAPSGERHKSFIKI